MVLCLRRICLDLRIGWVSTVLTYSFMSFSLVPLDDFSTNSMFNPLVSEFAMLSLDFT